MITMASNEKRLLFMLHYPSSNAVGLAKLR